MQPAWSYNPKDIQIFQRNKWLVHIEKQATMLYKKVPSVLRIATAENEVWKQMSTGGAGVIMQQNYK